MAVAIGSISLIKKTRRKQLILIRKESNNLTNKHDRQLQPHQSREFDRDFRMESSHVPGLVVVFFLPTPFYQQHLSISRIIKRCVKCRCFTLIEVNCN